MEVSTIIPTTESRKHKITASVGEERVTARKTSLEASPRSVLKNSSLSQSMRFNTSLRACKKCYSHFFLTYFSIEPKF
jgi:hypothetical protein